MNSFPNSMQPEGSLYCGPYCIAACLQAFGVLPNLLPIKVHKFNLEQNEFNGELVEISAYSDLNELALELYAITGILNIGEKARYVEGGGFNSIGAILYLLNQFGLKAEVIIRDDHTHNMLKEMFSDELDAIDKLQVSVSMLGDNVTQRKNAILIPVIAYDDTVHYVASNDRGDWFDSGLPEHLYYWDPIEKWDISDNKRENASWFGVAIRVSE